MKLITKVDILPKAGNYPITVNGDWVINNSMIIPGLWNQFGPKGVDLKGGNARVEISQNKKICLIVNDEYYPLGAWMNEEGDTLFISDVKREFVWSINANEEGEVLDCLVYPHCAGLRKISDISSIMVAWMKYR